MRLNPPADRARRSGCGLVVAGTSYLFLVGSVPAYRNPVLGNDAPDPAVIRAPDGKYYAYTTQSYFGAQFVNIPILRSTDLVEWELVGDAFPDNPGWAVRSRVTCGRRT